jgi:hypothetical protein
MKSNYLWNAEEFNDKGWITKELNKELQGKSMLIANMYVNIKVFKVKIHLWEIELKTA